MRDLEKLSSMSYSLKERGLGVATNRALHDAQHATDPTAVYYGVGTYVHIDIEKDPLLVDFLSTIQARVDATAAAEEKARQVAQAVVDLTPVVDETGAAHGPGRRVFLGEVLQAPVECLERALAMEAGMKMNGIAEAYLLESIDRWPDGVFTRHADVQFITDYGPYVAITTGEYAGQTMSRQQYTQVYLPERELQGLGHRQIQDDRPVAYFEPVPRGDSLFFT